MASQAERYDPFAIPTRRMTREDLLRAADYWGVEAGGLSTEALRVRVKQVAEARWQDENRVAIDEFNTWVLEHGIPHADLRRI